MSRNVRLALAALVPLIAACEAKTADAPANPTGHLFTSASAGFGLDLPTVWAGRYRATDSVTTPAAGLEREIAFRFLKSDSTVESAPLMVVRIFKTDIWRTIPADAAAGLYGTVIASDDARTVAVRTAPGNPLTAGTADALAFDSLMMIVLERPLRASLRPTP